MFNKELQKFKISALEELSAHPNGQQYSTQEG